MMGFIALDPGVKYKRVTLFALLRVSLFCDTSVTVIGMKSKRAAYTSKRSDFFLYRKDLTIARKPLGDYGTTIIV
jgi:hypothetical protein